jgi:hypothetical protein
MKVNTANNGVVLIKAVSLNDDKVNYDKTHQNNPYINNNTESRLILNASDLKESVSATIDKTFSQAGSVFVERTIETDEKLSMNNNSELTSTFCNRNKIIYELVNENSSKKTTINESHENPAFEFTDLQTVSDESSENPTSSRTSDGNSEQQNRDRPASSVVSYMNSYKNIVHSTPNNISLSDSITQSTAASSTVGLFKRSEMYSVEQADALSRFNVSNTIPSKVTLSWNHMTIRIKKKKPIERLISMVCPKKRGKYETILDNVKGVVQPGEMLALMGSR